MRNIAEKSGMVYDSHNWILCCSFFSFHDVYSTRVYTEQASEGGIDRIPVRLLYVVCECRQCLVKGVCIAYSVLLFAIYLFSNQTVSHKEYL